MVCLSIISIVYFQLGQYGIVLGIAISLLSLVLENYRTLRNMIFKGKDHQIRNLFIFQSLKYYNTYSIDYHTSHDTMDTLIREAQKTEVFTLVFHYDFQTNIKYMHVEFVQDHHSYVVAIPLTLRFPLILQEKITLLYDHIFRSNSVLQVWGDMDYELMRKYAHLSLDISDIQNKFKEWYNDTFVHGDKCPQRSIDEYMDGPTCTCANRPYKLSADQWSLSRAINFAFQIDFDLPMSEIHQCFAITQLATVIRYDWGIYHLEIYTNMNFECHDVAN